MATSLIIEEERGTCGGHVHPHNGYYAGEFRSRAVTSRRVPADRPGNRPSRDDHQPVR